MSTSTGTSTLPETASTEPSIPLIKTRDGAITKVSGEGLTGAYWHAWNVRMMSLLALCEVESYVRGEIEQPNKDIDPVGHTNWQKNDNYARHLIIQNVGDTHRRITLYRLLPFREPLQCAESFAFKEFLNSPNFSHFLERVLYMLQTFFISF